MPALKEKAPSIIAALLIALLSYGFSRIIFSPGIESRERALQEKRSELRETKELLSRKKESEAEWEKVKPLLPRAQSPEEALNQWVKEVLILAQSEGIVFSKLEPEGIKGKGEIKLLLGFQGDIRKFIRFLYSLLEKDPLSRVRTFSLKEEEDSKVFSYEIHLERPLL